MNYEYLLGKKINKVVDKKETIEFYTDDEIISIDKFIPYCACNVGEYIDDIQIDGEVDGIITNIETNMENLSDNDKYYEIVYKGNITFYFDNKKINMKVHGEDSGYYGVCFEAPVVIRKLNEEEDL